MKNIQAAPSAEVTSQVIYEAISSPTPRSRYTCTVIDDKGTPATLFKWLAWLLPDRVKDTLLFNA